MSTSGSPTSPPVSSAPPPWAPGGTATSTRPATGGPPSPTRRATSSTSSKSPKNPEITDRGLSPGARIVGPMTTNTDTTPSAPDTAEAPGPPWPTITSPQVTWFEVHTANAAETTEFYAGLFGWTFTTVSDDYQDI